MERTLCFARRIGIIPREVGSSATSVEHEWWETKRVASAVEPFSTSGSSASFVVLRWSVSLYWESTLVNRACSVSLAIPSNRTDSYPSFTDGISPSAPDLGLDLEWEDQRVTILGTAANGQAYSCQTTPEKLLQLSEIIEESGSIIGHNLVQSDRSVLEGVNCRIPLDKCFDTLIYFYLTNSHLCKARVEKAKSDEGEKRGGGFMNLWTMASLYTDLPNWKECRLSECAGPCPQHNVFHYNALDALAPLLARPKLELEAAFKRVGHLSPLLHRVSAIAARMRDTGITVDLDYLEKLELQFEQDRAGVLLDLPPEMLGPKEISPKKVISYFKERYNVAPKSTSEEDLRTFAEKYDFEEAHQLVEYKEGGKGFKSWFDRRFIRDGCLHPNFYPAGATATGRWASSNPNFQNIPVRRSAEIRRVIVARPHYLLYKADYKQAEARVVLYESGYQPPDDLKSWLLSEVGIAETDPGVRALGGVWNATKSLIHAANYGEGLILLDPHDLSKPYYTNAIAKGALEVHRDWTFEGKVVGFTGVNLANRMFGEASLQSRARALAMQNRYFSRFPGVRDYQKRISREVERDGLTRSPFGFLLQLYGFPVNTLKTAWAMRGSNPVSLFTSYAICRAEDAGLVGNLRAQVHDELLWEFPDDRDPVEVATLIKHCMEFSHEAMPGFKIPVEVSCGKNWADMRGVA